MIPALTIAIVVLFLWNLSLENSLTKLYTQRQQAMLSKQALINRVFEENQRREPEPSNVIPLRRKYSEFE